MSMRGLGRRFDRLHPQTRKGGGQRNRKVIFCRNSPLKFDAQFILIVSREALRAKNILARLPRLLLYLQLVLPDLSLRLSLAMLIQDLFIWDRF